MAIKNVVVTASSCNIVKNLMEINIKYQAFFGIFYLQNNNPTTILTQLTYDWERDDDGG